MIAACVLACILSIGIIFLTVFLQFKRHNNFMKSSLSIKKGMTLTNVSLIMQKPAASTEENGKNTIVIWEKRQWKGMFYGGTVTRNVKVIFENNLVVSVTTTNFAVPIFF